jgi:hypothetical protein
LGRTALPTDDQKSRFNLAVRRREQIAPPDSRCERDSDIVKGTVKGASR